MVLQIVLTVLKVIGIILLCLLALLLIILISPIRYKADIGYHDNKPVIKGVITYFFRFLRIYADYLEGHLYHFRDNASGDEVDAIVEFKDGRYAAFEIKLSDGSIQDAIRSLMKFQEKVEKKAAYLCVIVGHLDTVMRDPRTGVFIVPITSLRP